MNPAKFHRGKGRNSVINGDSCHLDSRALKLFASSGIDLGIKGFLTGPNMASMAVAGLVLP